MANTERKTLRVAIVLQQRREGPGEVLLRCLNKAAAECERDVCVTVFEPPVLADEGDGVAGCVEENPVSSTITIDESLARRAVEENDLVFLLGGPFSVWDEHERPYLLHVFAAIGRALELRRPMLACCLGAQALARCVGWRVESSRGLPRVGPVRSTLCEAASSDRVFRRFETTGISSFRWHGDLILPPLVSPPPPVSGTHETVTSGGDGGAAATSAAIATPPRAPAEVVVLASSDDTPVQAFRVGPCAYGVQFHPELGVGDVAEWVALPWNQGDLEALALTRESVVHAHEAALPRYEADSMTIVRALVQLSSGLTTAGLESGEA